MKAEQVHSIAVLDDEDPSNVFIITDRKRYTVSKRLYDEIRNGKEVPVEGMVVNPAAVINWLDEVNPLLFDSQVAKEVDEQLRDMKKEETKWIIYAFALGIVIICAAVAYIMITKSAEVAVVASGSPGTGITVK